MNDIESFIRTHTALTAPPLVPEIRLHLATEVVPLWKCTEEELAERGLPPPFWAFAWAGGQALARYVMDNRDSVEGKAVLDLGSGSGVVAIAAAKAGARSVLAVDIDPFAASAISLNASANAAKITTCSRDVIGSPCEWRTLLIGDMFYERPLAERLLAWLQTCARSQVQILLGDPGRSYFPKSAVTQLAMYRVPTTRELEDRELRETGVYRLLPS